MPAAYAQLVGEKLALHGIEFRKLIGARSAGTDAKCSARRKVTPAPRTFEGHTLLDARRSVDAASGATSPAGSLFVPIAQAQVAPGR